MAKFQVMSDKFNVDRIYTEVVRSSKTIVIMMFLNYSNL
jgi:hypothetical protein